MPRCKRELGRTNGNLKLLIFVFTCYIQFILTFKVILVLCSHYMTIKLNETWLETKLQSPGLLVQDEDVLDEFLEINKYVIRKKFITILGCLNYLEPT